MEKRLNAKLIKETLRKKHLTQNDLASHLGVGHTTISHYMGGRLIPSPERLQEISGFLDIPTGDLWEDSGNEAQEILEKVFGVSDITPKRLIERVLMEYSGQMICAYENLFDENDGELGNVDQSIKDKVLETCYHVWARYAVQLRKLNNANKESIGQP